MDKIKTAFGYTSAGYWYAVAWVEAHPVATVNCIFAAVVARIAMKVAL